TKLKAIMKKLILFLCVMLAITSCNTLTEDPHVQVSEYEEVIVKAKADTLNPTIVVEGKTYFYFVKNEKITGRIVKESGDGPGGLFVGILLGMLLMGLIMNNRD